jgi:hypothetical protein
MDDGQAKQELAIIVIINMQAPSSRVKRSDPEKTKRVADLKRLDCHGASRLAKTL